MRALHVLAHPTEQATTGQRSSVAGTHWARPAVIHVAVLLSYLLLTLVMTWPLATQLTTVIPGDSFDGWQNYWNQWWIKVALVDRLQNPFTTDLLYYPTGVGLYFHTLNPFNGVTTLPVQLSLGLIPAYNAVVLLSWVLGGYGVYLLVRWLLRGEAAPTAAPHFAAFMAGVIFTFSPFHMAHLLGHMQVMSLEWIPFYLLYLLRSVDQSRQGQSWVRSALLAGFFLTLVGLCDWYFVLYLFFFTALFTVWNAVRTPLRNWLTLVLPPLLAGCVMLALLSPVLLPMVREATQFSFMVRPTSDLYTFSASLLDFLVPNRLHTLFRPESFTWPGNQIAPVSERTISIGYVALLLALVALWQQPRRRFFWLICALFFLSLALGPRWQFGNITAAEIPDATTTLTHWTPFALLNQVVPFMRISRSVSRYALMVQLSVAVLAGLGLGRYLTQRGKVAKLQSSLVSSLLLGLILFEYWVAPYPMSPPDTPAFYTQLRTMADTGAVLNLPMNYDRPGYLLYQTVHQKPLAVAYISRDDPRTLTERVPLLQQLRRLGPDIIALDPVTVGPTVLQDLGIGIVIQDRYKMPGGLEREYTEAVANALFADQPPLFADERITVHRVVAPSMPQPYLALGALNWGPLAESPTGQQRAITGPAQIQLYHGTQVRGLTLHYRTVTGVGLRVTTTEGDLMTTLPSAPEGNQAIIPMAKVAQSNGELGIMQSVMLTTDSSGDGTGEVWINQIGLAP